MVTDPKHRRLGMRTLIAGLFGGAMKNFKETDVQDKLEEDINKWGNTDNDEVGVGDLDSMIKPNGLPMGATSSVYPPNNIKGKDMSKLWAKFHDKDVQHKKKAKSQNDFDLKMMNSAWFSSAHQFKLEFMGVMKEAYQCQVEQVSFKKPDLIANQMNSWVSNATNKMIPHLIDPSDINASTIMFLINTIHFKGKWQTSFDKNITAPGKFTTASNSGMDVQYMNGEDMTINYLQQDKGDGAGIWFELPYTGGDVSMVVYLPDKVDTKFS